MIPDPFREGLAGARARRMRSIGIGVALVALVALIFAITVVKLNANLHHG